MTRSRMKVCRSAFLRLHLKPDKSMLLKLSLRSAGSEIQICGRSGVAERAAAENSSVSSIVKQTLVAGGISGGKAHRKVTHTGR